MTKIRIPLHRRNDMDLLIKTYPNISEDMLLKGGCYLLVMKRGAYVTYDCRNHPYKRSCKLRGFGYEFDRFLTHYNSTVATRHIKDAPNGINYEDVKTLYLLSEEEYDLFDSIIKSDQKSFHDILVAFSEIEGCDETNRYFCTTKLDVIINIKPHGLVYNPQWCKASAVYDAVEELSLVSPHSTGFTWWYYPGRMYFKWKEISKNDFLLAKNFIDEKEKAIFNRINTIVG